MRGSIALLTICCCALTGEAHSVSAQNVVDCGPAPTVPNETLKGKIDGSARFISGFFGKAALEGEIETTRTNIFSLVKEGGGANLADTYLQYQVCSFLSVDQNLNTIQKIDQLIRVRQTFSRAISDAAK